MKRSLDGGFCFRLFGEGKAAQHVYGRLLGILFSFVLLTGCTSLHAASPASLDAPIGVMDDGLWQQVRHIKPDQSVTMAAFPDEDRGLTVGCQGAVSYTGDGGTTWQRAENQGACQWDVEVVDEQVAWSVGNGGLVGRSTDGWQSWQTDRINGYDLHFASFLDAQIGWVVSAGARRLWVTTDGAQSWTQVRLPPKIKIIVDVVLRTPTDGYVLDQAGTLYVTQDGGQSWASRSLGLDKGRIPRSPHTAAMRFFDAERGIVVLNLLQSGKASMLAMRTADGGQTWEQEPVPVPPGYLHLARDGRTLSVIEDDKTHGAFNSERTVTVFRYQPSAQ